MQRKIKDNNKLQTRYNVTKQKAYELIIKMMLAFVTAMLAAVSCGSKKEAPQKKVLVLFSSGKLGWHIRTTHGRLPRNGRPERQEDCAFLH